MVGIITHGDLLEAQEGRRPARTAQGGGGSYRRGGGRGWGGGRYKGEHDHDHGGLSDGGLLLRGNTLRPCWGSGDMCAPPCVSVPGIQGPTRYNHKPITVMAVCQACRATSSSHPLFYTEG
jgi:hypothetical protein